MGRSIAIVGAGQGGLQLAIGLLSHGHRVTLVTDRSAKEILNGTILSSQGMFDKALQHERALGIDFWQNDAPQNSSITCIVTKPGGFEVDIQFRGLVTKPFQSVDQRLKFSRWLDEVAHRGGEIVIQTVTPEILDQLAHSHDLTIVASGKSALSQLFKRDNNRSSHTKPPRVLSCLYVTGMNEATNYPGICFTIIPGIGEFFSMPGFGKNGLCDMWLFEGIPNGPFDGWTVGSPQQQLEKAQALLQQYVPWEAQRFGTMALTDANAVLTGSYTPEVRYPICTLRSGKSLLGMSDAVVLNDPIAGQGANNASKCAKIYLDKILAHHGTRSFDEQWMQDTFECFWDDAQWSTTLTNLLLIPPEAHVMELFTAASEYPQLANAIADGFDNPKNLFPHIALKSKIKAWINTYEQGDLVVV